MNLTTKISLRIVLLFTTAILLSIVPDYLHTFFGDEICNGLIKNVITGKIEYYYHYGSEHKDIVIHWGYRHWLYFLMGMSLAFIQFVNIINTINNEPNN